MKDVLSVTERSRATNGPARHIGTSPIARLRQSDARRVLRRLSSVRVENGRGSWHLGCHRRITPIALVDAVGTLRRLFTSAVSHRSQFLFESR